MQTALNGLELEEHCQMGNTSRKCCQHINIQIRELSMGRVRNTRNSAEKYGRKGDKHLCERLGKQTNLLGCFRHRGRDREVKSSAKQSKSWATYATRAIQDTNSKTINFCAQQTRTSFTQLFVRTWNCTTDDFRGIKIWQMWQHGAWGHINAFRKIITANSLNIRLKSQKQI